MSVAVTPKSVGSVGSTLVHFSEPMPGKFRAPFWNKGRLYAALLTLLGVYVLFLTVNAFVAGETLAGVVSSVLTLMVFASAFQVYHNWFNDQESKYVKDVMVPFFNEQVFGAVSSWLTSEGLAVRYGDSPDMYDTPNGERLYRQFHEGEDMEVGTWIRSFEVFVDGTVEDSGKGYAVRFTPAGKDTVEVFYEVVDNSDD